MKEENSSTHNQQKQSLGITQKQRALYQEIFLNFSQDSQCLSAIDFFKVCKILRVYPVIISFEHLKKVVLRNPDYWYQKKSSSSSNNEINGTLFYFKDFIKAFKIIAKIGYKNIDDVNNNRFLQLTNYLRKQLSNYLQKAEKGQPLLSENLNSETRSIQSYENYQQPPPVPGQLQRHQYSNSSASYQVYQIQNPQKTISPNHAYYEQTLTPQADRHMSAEKNLGQLSAKFVSSTLTTNEHRGARSNYHQLAILSQEKTQKRNTIDNKSEISSRPMSKAYSCVRGNPKIAHSLMIPKVKLKKKGMKQPNINSFLTLKQSFNDPASYSISYTQQDRKPTTAQQFIRAKLKGTRHDESPAESQKLFQQPSLTSKQSYNNVTQQAAIFKTVVQEHRDSIHSNSLKREENSQKSFRIRKYSRASSRSSSRPHSARGEAEQEELKLEEKDKRTIETPPDLNSYTDLNLKKVNVNLKEKFKSSSVPESKYKQERDMLIVCLRQVKKAFDEFKARHEGGSKQVVEQQINSGETGHQQKDDLLEQLKQKDDRIKDLEEEVRRLRERQSELVNQIEHQL